MIHRIEGKLVGAAEGRAALECGAITYELLVPGCDASWLAGQVGGTVAFHTLHYLEGQAQGTSLVPRLVGFRTPEDRAFFEVFTTVKGVGPRKALRALQLPFGRVAEAIAGEDVDLLVSLPEIGRRTAQTIVAELQGRVDRFVELKPLPAAAGDPARAELARDAVAVLVRLGEPPAPTKALVDRALAADPALGSAEAVVAAALRLKELP